MICFSIHRDNFKIIIFLIPLDQMMTSIFRKLFQFKTKCLSAISFVFSIEEQLYILYFQFPLLLVYLVLENIIREGDKF